MFIGDLYVMRKLHFLGPYAEQLTSLSTSTGHGSVTLRFLDSNGCVGLPSDCWVQSAYTLRQGVAFRHVCSRDVYLLLGVYCERRESAADLALATPAPNRHISGVFQ